MTRKELVENIYRKKTFLCVGLDPDITKFPLHLRGDKEKVFEFNKNIIDATAEFAVAFKPNLAFYEYLGLEGIAAFEKTVRYISENYPDQFIIADAKRGDIGNTAKMYAKSFFEYYGVDAVTVAPYMGRDSVQPFLDHKGKWTILLALTSNNSAADFQMITDSEGHKLYEDVIIKSKEWGTKDDMMYVVGATKQEMLKRVRELIPDNFLLVPGVGAQGGSLEDVVRNGMTDECGLLVNSSRGIIYASETEDYAKYAAEEAYKLAKQMAGHLA